MIEVYLVRHGQTEWNASRRMQGQWNSNLNDTGRDQAHSHGRFLATRDIQHLVASPLDRTRQTAEIVSRYLNLNPVFDDRIKEWDCGDWSGEYWDTLADKWPEDFAAWRDDEFNYRPPNCENYPDMMERARPLLDELRESPFERVAIVSHGIIGRVMVGLLMQMSPDEMFSFHQPNDIIFHLTFRDPHYLTQHFTAGTGPHPGLPPRLHR